MTHLGKTRSEALTHRLVGRILCLDFANTINGHGKSNAHEYLLDYADLALWCWKAGILVENEAEALLREADRHPDQAQAVYESAKNLRENIYAIFSAIAHGTSTAAADLAALNQARAEAFDHSQIVAKGDRFDLDWIDKTALDRPLWPIALSATDLLISENTGRVRQCAGKDCEWLFLDTSRNHLRRWCTMDECGNRAKSHRFAAHGAAMRHSQGR